MTVLYVIRAVAFANGQPCPHTDELLESFDHDACGGRGYGEFTTRPSKAKHFASYNKALQFWAKCSTVKPVREDGWPNRPLTALTVVIESL
jgi:hypothetical protein